MYVAVHRIEIVWLGLSNYQTIAEIIFYASNRILSHLKPDIQNGTVDQHIGSVVVVIVICCYYYFSVIGNPTGKS
jgi:hypothetical protein